MRARIVATMLALAVVTAGFVGWRVLDDDEAQPDTVVAYFADASPLDRGSAVRAFGVGVGNIDSIELEGNVARVTMSVDSKVLPLHRDATLTIRPVNLLGEHYIELDTGSPGEPSLADNIVALEATRSTVDLQDVIDTFDDPTSAGLAALLTTLGEGVEGGGAEAAAAIRALAPAMSDLGGLAEVLSDQNTVLNSLIDRVTPVAAALGGQRGEALNGLVANAETLLSTLSAKQSALNATLLELPATLRSARATLAQLSATASSTTPKLEALRPVTEDLSSISRELRRFAESADPALASLVPVLKRADDLLAQARPSVARLSAAGPALERAGEDLVPLGDVVLDRNLEDLMLFVKKWSLSTNGRDGLSHYFRGVVHASPAALRDLFGPGSIPLTGPEGTKPLDDAVDRVTDALKNPLKDPLKNIDKTLDHLLGGLGGALGGTGSQGGRDRGNATGLTSNQELSLLDQLLGGN